MWSITKRYFTEVIRGKRDGPATWIVKGLLHCLSWPYRFFVFCRNWAYDHDWLRQYQPPVPVVVSVGNIVVGGSGKTPATLMLAGAFYKDFQVGILSRGYNSPVEKLATPVTLCAGQGPVHSAAYCGDEPYLLAANLPHAFVFVGRNRSLSANMAAKAGVEILFLDDGMQHRQLGRDYDVVVMDMDDPLGQNNYLPRGLLRESPKSLARADLVIVNHVNDSAALEHIKQVVRKYSTAPIVGTRIRVAQVYDLHGSEVDSLQDKKVAVFCAIAQPEKFYETVERLGAHIIGQTFFIDHQFFHTEEIEKLAGKYKALGAELLVCTEKDRVKLPDFLDLPLPLVWVKMELQVVYGRQELENFIHRIRKNLARISPK